MGKQEEKNNDLTNEQLQELHEIELFKGKLQARKKCTEEINKILDKYEARLAVDPNSKVSEMHIIVILNN